MTTTKGNAMTDNRALIEQLRKAEGSKIMRSVLLGPLNAEVTCIHAARALTAAQAKIEALEAERAAGYAQGVAAKVKPLSWTPGKHRKGDLYAFTECGHYSVFSLGKAEWCAVLRRIDGDQQCEDVEIGSADDRDLVIDDCEYDYRTRIAAALLDAPAPVPAQPSVHVIAERIAMNLGFAGYHDAEEYVLSEWMAGQIARAIASGDQT